MSSTEYDPATFLIHCNFGYKQQILFAHRQLKTKTDHNYATILIRVSGTESTQELCYWKTTGGIAFAEIITPPKS